MVENAISIDNLINACIDDTIDELLEEDIKDSEIKLYTEEVIKKRQYADNSYEEEQYKLSSYQAYYNEIRLYPILTKEEEQALFIKWKKHNDLSAKERIYLCNLRYVCKVALNYHYKNSQKKRLVMFDINDLVQEGNIGLWTALEKFDYTKGYRLLTFASDYIFMYINRAVYNNEDAIRVPVHIKEDYYKIQKAFAFIYKHNKKDKIDLDKVAKISNMNIEKVKKTLETVKQVSYFDTPIANSSSKQEKSNKTFQDLLHDKHSSDLLELIIEDNIKSEKYSFLNKLNISEKDLILQKYGYMKKVVTDNELALLNNTSVKEIEKTITRAKRKLRQNQKRPLYN